MKIRGLSIALIATLCGIAFVVILARGFVSASTPTLTAEERQLVLERFALAPMAQTSETVDLALLPANTTVAPSEEFDLVVQAEAGTAEVNGVEVHLNFDPSLLEVVSITPGTGFSFTLLNTFDNTAGTIDYSVAQLTAPFPSGTFDVMTIRFRAEATTAGTTVEFVQSPPRVTLVTLNGEIGNALGTATDATVVIEAAVTDTPTATSTMTPSQTPSQTPSMTPSNTPTDTPSATATATDGATSTFTPTPTATETEAGTSTFTPTATNTTEPTSTFTATATSTDGPTSTFTATPTATNTTGPTSTFTATNTVDPNATPVPTSVPGTGPTATNVPAEYVLCENSEMRSDSAFIVFGSIDNAILGTIIGNVYCRIIVQDGQVITSLAEVGIQAVIDLDVIQAIDLFGLAADGTVLPNFIQPVSICLRGTGQVIYLNAANAGRIPTLLPVYPNSPSEYSCVSVPAPGTVILVRDLG